MTSANDRLPDTRKRTIALLVLIFYPVVFGVADLVFYTGDTSFGVSEVLSTIIGVIAIVVWCTLDARIRGFPFVGGLRVLVWLLAAIGVPIYLKRTRGWLGAAKIGFGFPAFAASIATYYVGWYAARWIAIKVGYFG